MTFIDGLRLRLCLRRLNLRGRYEGGGMIVTARRWWSPWDRKSAKLAARVLEYERSKSGRYAYASARALSHWPDPLYYGSDHPSRWTASS